jgi:AraC-like DNA-binding protein
MRIRKPPWALAGFRGDQPDPLVPEILFAGEQWLPSEHRFPDHAHPVWEFYLQLDGTSIWQDTVGRDYRCAPGTFFAPPPNFQHRLAHVVGSRHHFLFVAVDIQPLVQRFPQLAEVWQRQACIFIPNAHSCDTSFRQLMREIILKRPLRTEGLRCALDALFVEVSRLLFEGCSGNAFMPLHPAVERARGLLEGQPGEPWTLAALGRVCGLSPNHLAQLFTDAVGVSPHRYLTQLRLERAKDLLRHSDASITQIALELGFSSSQHFAWALRRATGQSAQAFRGKNRS